MSSVRKKDQKAHRFTTLDQILNMYEHTSNVISNEKIFLPKFQKLIDRMDYESSMIYHCCRCANEDYDNRVKEEAEIRIKLQEEAINHCLWLKTDIRLAQKKFHIREKRIIYWNGLVNTALNSIKSWNATEKRLYKDNFGS